MFQADAKDAITISQGHAFLHFGFTSNPDGTVSRHEFDMPKEITFVINFTDYETLQELAVSLPCPRSAAGSLLQNRLINDRSIQHMILSSEKLLHLIVSEETNAAGGFKYDMLKALNSDDEISVLDFKVIASYLKKYVADYFDLNPMTHKIVIKNTSWKMPGHTGSLILDRCDVDALPEKLKQLNISSSDNVLVEQFIPEYPDNRIRIYSTSNGESFFQASKNLRTVPLSFALYCTDETATPYATSDTLLRQMNTITKRYWDTILPYLKKVDEGAELMVFGFDFVISPEGPVCVQVSGLDSLSLYSLYISERYGDECGYEPLCGMFNHILNRSYDYMLHDRTIVLAGVGYYAKLQLFKYLEYVGAHIILLDDKPPPPWASGYVEHFIQASLYDPALYEETAKKAAMKIKEFNMKPFSVISLYEDYIPFRAVLEDILRQEGLLESKGHNLSVESAFRNKDKVRIYNTIKEAEQSYLKPSQSSTAANAIVLTDENVPTLEIEFPHILKLSTASCAFGCMRMNTTNDIVPAYEAAKKMIATTSTKAGVGLCFGVQIFMSELYEGSEHDVDVVMRDGEAVFHMFGDNLPVAAGEGTGGHQFVEKGCIMPSRIITGLEEEEILSSIVDALNSLDLSHGVINVEFFLTDKGIKIIDINPRPGGYYINEWMNTIAGVCSFTAEVILHSGLEYFVQPLVYSRSITGYNVLSKKELAGEIARYSNIPKDVQVFRMQDPNGETSTTDLYASIYNVTDYRLTNCTTE